MISPVWSVILAVAGLVTMLEAGKHVQEDPSEQGGGQRGNRLKPAHLGKVDLPAEGSSGGPSWRANVSQVLHILTVLIAAVELLHRLGLIG